MNYFNPQLLAGHLNQCLSNPHNFLHLTPLLLSRSPTHFLLEVTFMAVGEPDYLFCIFYHLFSCRGSYLGSPLPMPLLIGPVPSTFEVFFFLWPFCLWCWSFHNVGRLSELLQSPTGHLKCHQVLNALQCHCRSLQWWRRTQTTAWVSVHQVMVPPIGTFLK